METHWSEKFDTWWDAARCLGISSNVFFAKEHEKLALKICAKCPVIVECRRTNDFAERHVTSTYWDGVYGGETAAQRRRRARELRRFQREPATEVQVGPDGLNDEPLAL